MMKWLTIASLSVLFLSAVAYAVRDGVSVLPGEERGTVQMSSPQFDGSGVAIGTHALITAAHVVDGFPVNQLYAVMPGGTMIVPQSVRVHPEYIGPLVGIDVAIVTFSQPLNLPIAQIGDVPPNPAPPLTVLGTGQTSDTDPAPDLHWGQEIYSRTFRPWGFLTTPGPNNTIAVRGDSGCGLWHNDQLIGIHYAGSSIGNTDLPSDVINAWYVSTRYVEDWIYSGHNHVFPEDVNGDGFVSPTDMLLILNELIRGHTAILPGEVPEYYWDVNQDSIIAPLDLLLVLNWLEMNPQAYLAQCGISPGDANCDGAVDWADFMIIQSNNGTAGYWQDGDFNHDGVVNGSDLTIWSDNYTG